MSIYVLIFILLYSFRSWIPPLINSQINIVKHFLCRDENDFDCDIVNEGQIIQLHNRIKANSLVHILPQPASHFKCEQAMHPAYFLILQAFFQTLPLLLITYGYFYMFFVFLCVTLNNFFILLLLLLSLLKMSFLINIRLNIFDEFK